MVAQGSSRACAYGQQAYHRCFQIANEEHSIGNPEVLGFSFQLDAQITVSDHQEPYAVQGTYSLEQD